MQCPNQEHQLTNMDSVFELPYIDDTLGDFKNLVFLISWSFMHVQTADMWMVLGSYLHFLIFGLLATNLIRIPLCSHKHLNSTLAFALTSLYGFADEYRQSFTLGRSVELCDALADSLGALVATQIYARWTAYQNLLEWPLLSLKKLFLKSRAKQRQR